MDPPCTGRQLPHPGRSTPNAGTPGAPGGPHGLGVIRHPPDARHYEPGFCGGTDRGAPHAWDTGGEASGPLYSACRPNVPAPWCQHPINASADPALALLWLASQMGQHSQTVFHIERIHPCWLPQEQQGIPQKCRPPATRAGVRAIAATRYRRIANRSIGGYKGDQRRRRPWSAALVCGYPIIAFRPILARASSSSAARPLTPIPPRTL